MYADRVTSSMHAAIDETQRRRKIQTAHNRKHGITPETIRKEITPIFSFENQADRDRSGPTRISETVEKFDTLEDIDQRIRQLEKEMQQAAQDLEFEKAAELRDQIKQLQGMVVF
jgi:excinuclease ABC subunit B